MHFRGVYHRHYIRDSITHPLVMRLAMQQFLVWKQMMIIEKAGYLDDSRFRRTDL